jgi:predicted dehydrogenase
LIAVFGSGFGLYGHVPALVELGRDVCVSVRYRSAFDERAELTAYRSAVHFVDDDASLLSKADLAVLVRRPADNDALARQAMLIRCPPQLVIEKPPAPTPQAALLLDSALRAAGVRRSTPYLLAHCEWARDCQRRVTSGRVGEITLDWHFNSQYTSGSWKAAPEEGGGPLSYYFIHVIALAEFFLGDHHVVECWATEEGSDRKIGMVAVNRSIRFTATFCASTDSVFSIALNGVVAMTAATPFGAIPRRGDRDPRIDTLKRFYTTEVFISSKAAHQRAEDRGRRVLEVWAELAERLRRENAACHWGDGERGFRSTDGERFKRVRAGMSIVHEK